MQEKCRKNNNNNLNSNNRASAQPRSPNNNNNNNNNNNDNNNDNNNKQDELQGKPKPIHCEVPLFYVSVVNHHLQKSLREKENSLQISFLNDFQIVTLKNSIFTKLAKIFVKTY